MHVFDRDSQFITSGKIRTRDILDFAMKSRIHEIKNYLHSEIMAVKSCSDTTMGIMA